MIVMKFGGTSVGSQEAFSQVAQIVKNQVQSETGSGSQQPGVAVVTSAMSGVTNLLIDAAKQAAQGDGQPYQATQTTLVEKHQAVLNALVSDSEEQVAINQMLTKRLDEFSRLCDSIAVLGELTPRGLDVVSGLGERMSAPLLAAVFRSQGIQAQFIDAAELIVTDKVHDGAEPIMALTEKQCQAKLRPMIEPSSVQRLMQMRFKF